MSEQKHFQVEDANGITTIRVVDSALSDLELQDELHEELLGFVKSRQPEKLLVDFSAVEYCNTGVINSLLSTKRRVAEYGGQFKLCGLTTHVDDAFVALNLKGTVFDVYDSCAEAKQAFGS